MPPQWGTAAAANVYTPAISTHPYPQTSGAATTARPPDYRPSGSTLGLR
jgi:hypothetical protein